MSNLNTIPLEDGFETSLSQAWDWAVWTVNVNATPNFTFPSGVTTYIVVNPTNSKIQIAKIDSYNSTNKTLNVTDITLEKGASVSSTAQTHPVNSKVIISDNYEFWKWIRAAINSKLDNDANWTWDAATDFWWLVSKSLTTAQRTALTPVNGMIVYDTDLSVHYQYIWGAWSTFATWSVVNADDTTAGKVEIATDAEITTPASDTWGTGASLMTKISQLIKLFSFAPVLTASDEADKYAFQDTSNWDKTTTITKANLRDDLAASETVKGTVERATDAEATTWTDTTRYITPKQAKDNYWVWTTTTSYSTTSSWATTYTTSKQITWFWFANLAIYWQTWNAPASVSAWIQTSPDNATWTTVVSQTFTISNSPWYSWLSAIVPNWYYVRWYAWWNSDDSTSVVLTIQDNA